MRTEALTLFLAVAENGSITEAARRSFISQQGASAMIKSLENELSTILFERRGSNKLTLTPEGKALAAKAADVVHAYNHLLASAAIQKLTPKERKPLRVVVTPWVSMKFSPVLEAYSEAIGMESPFALEERSIFDIAREFPHLDKKALYLVTIECHTKRIREKLFPGFEPLLIMDVLLCGKNECPLLRKKKVSQEDLKGSRFALFNDEQLLRISSHILKGIPDAKVELRTSNVTLLNTKMENEGLLSFTDSYVCSLGGGFLSSDWTASLEERTSFVLGVLGGINSEEAADFICFVRRYLETYGSSYMREYPLESLGPTGELV